ncbi:hypothetical protein PGTUg99_033265 [Puccinia graminis f. sp. tritici]|uniref:Uncharacterized protein n=1 Tax=Puccinia graminis f. sp. tritici TaxID=56615 RepID=A0A5B0RPW8_PUCGR|nr:hypothetical protein PGTUg99_033265 [Puccinia graminis f. sp. tritici]
MKVSRPDASLKCDGSLEVQTAICGDFWSSAYFSKRDAMRSVVPPKKMIDIHAQGTT